MSMIDGKLDISVYHDGVDEPISQAQHITNRVALVRKTESKRLKNTKAFREAMRKKVEAYIYNINQKPSAKFVPPVSLSKVTKKKGGKV
jgi:hypothetical protein